MNWAELHELSVTQKATHAQVDYKKGTKREHCSNCKNFIPCDRESRCRTVLCPIEPEMWCRRYSPN
jgi:hypothetical protein